MTDDVIRFQCLQLAMLFRGECDFITCMNYANEMVEFVTQLPASREGRELMERDAAGSA